MLHEIHRQLHEHVLGDAVHEFVPCFTSGRIGIRFFRLDLHDFLQHGFGSIRGIGDIGIGMQAEDLRWIGQWELVDVVDIIIETLSSGYPIGIVELEVRREQVIGKPFLSATHRFCPYQ